MLRQVPNSVDFPALEREVLTRWQRERTFERSLEQRRGAPQFVFYDGPPFATGLPHYGHILTSFIKDVVPRYHTMRGCHVPRRWGWDCHGLPAELEVEKELGLASPADIARYGVGAFNDACRGLVMRYASEWERIVTRLGRWVDFAGAYKTMDDPYVETVVACFAQLHARGLVYEGQKVVPYCTRCQTALSNFETRLDDSYRVRDDLAVTVRFALAERESLLAWTTTPWTLPANAALAVHPALEYVRMESAGESVWLAANAVERFDLAGYRERERVRGAALVGRRYRAVFDYFAETGPVLAAEWVSADEGTGVVHLAPAYGEDDHVTCAAAGVTGAAPVRDDGTYDERVGELAGMDVFAANEPITRMLERAGKLFARGTVRHDYPHCWRCDRPLVYRAIPSWFVRVTEFRDRLVANNAAIAWVPAHVGEKRFADWLANARDWAISRNRFWGAPVPVWRCHACATVRAFGGRAELEAASGRAVTDWHRPHIDEVVVPCACGGEMRRVPEVLDCWFESGAMPYAGGLTGFPGDFVVEYVAQTRGWFYTMLVLSTALHDAPPFRHAVCHGVLLGEDGRKLGKRLRNYPDPMVMVDQHGSDALRAALLASGAASGNDVKFSAAAVRDSVRRLHLPLWNALHLYTSYAVADGFEPTGACNGGELERALLAETEQLRTDLEDAMARYDFVRAYELLEAFVTTLSTWYLRLLKPTLWRPGLDEAKRATYEALHAAFVQLAHASAPFLPFLAELVHEALGGTESVHLADWPAPRPALRDDALLAEMQQLRTVVRLARRAREDAGVRHRQPLARASIAGVANLAKYRELLASELNVKHVEALADGDASQRELVLDFARLGKRLRERMKPVAAAARAGQFEALGDGRVRVAGELLAADEFSWRSLAREGVAVVLDLAVDEALAREGLARDLNRAVQDLRKRARLAYDAQVRLAVCAATPLAALEECLTAHGRWLCEQAASRELVRYPLGSQIAASVELDGGTVTLELEPL